MSTQTATPDFAGSSFTGVSFAERTHQTYPPYDIFEESLFDIPSWFYQIPIRLNELSAINHETLDREIRIVKAKLDTVDIQRKPGKAEWLMHSFIPNGRNTLATKYSKDRFKAQNAIAGLAKNPNLNPASDQILTLSPEFTIDYNHWMNAAGNSLTDAQREFLFKIRTIAFSFAQGRSHQIDSTVATQLCMILLSPPPIRIAYLRAFLARFVFDNLTANMKAEIINRKINILIELILDLINQLKFVSGQGEITPPEA